MEITKKSEKVCQEVQKDAIISIIVPSYNVERYIVEAFDSVINQSYKNWECIVIDDHSGDNTQAVILEYVERYPANFRFYENPGKGACAARNFGLTIAKGDFIKFLDSDDALYDEDTLKTQISFLQGNQLDIVFGIEHYFQDTFINENIVKMRGAALNDSNIHTYFFSRFPITSNFLLRIPTGLKLRWSENLRSGQEFHFLFTCMLNRLKFGFQNIPTAKIRIHNSIHRISNKTPKVYVQQTFDLIRNLSDDMVNYRYENIDLLSAFNIWKLRWSFSALSAGNHTAFRSIQQELVKLDRLIIENDKIKFLYRINSLNPYLAFAFYKIFGKLTNVIYYVMQCNY